MTRSETFYVLQYNDTFNADVRGTFAVVGNAGMFPASDDALNSRVTRFVTRKEAQKYAGSLFHVRKVSATYVLGD